MTFVVDKPYCEDTLHTAIKERKMSRNDAVRLNQKGLIAKLDIYNNITERSAEFVHHYLKNCARRVVLIWKSSCAAKAAK